MTFKLTCHSLKIIHGTTYHSLKIIRGIFSSIFILLFLVRLSAADGHIKFNVPFPEDHSRYPINWQGLPDPYHTDSANNPPRLIPRPEHALLSLPEGFVVEEYLPGFLGPRFMLLGPDNEILLSHSESGNSFISSDIIFFYPQSQPKSVPKNLYNFSLYGLKNSDNFFRVSGFMLGF